MLKPRKTIEVERIKKRINADLANDAISEETKKHLGSLLVGILFETGNYRGFNFLDWINGGCQKWREDGCPADNSKYLGSEYTRIYY